MTNQKPLKVLISAGGTGGGIYPALAVAEALRRVMPDCQLDYVGSIGGMESTLVPRDLFAGYHEVQSGPLHGVGLIRLIISLGKLAVGFIQSMALVRRVRPDVLFLTGGWVTFPVALACWLNRLPIAIFLPDIEPALAIKTLSRLARIVMTTTAESAQYFPAGTTILETGYPLREEVTSATRPKAIEHFQLDPNKKTLLVFGGSRGARSINQALMDILPDLLSDGLQLIHVTGELDWPNVKTRLDSLKLELGSDNAHYPNFTALATKDHVYPYLHEDMGLAFAAADLVISRAGASILGEFPYFGLPAVLIPYPFAWRYQKVNADWLVTRGAALRLDDEAMKAELLPTIRTLINNPAQLGQMRQAAASLAKQEAAAEIARRLIDLAQVKNSTVV